MAKVTIINDNVSFEMPDGEHLLRFAQEHSSMLFGCGKGRCGICICSVISGMENLNPKSHHEMEVLRTKMASDNKRLACQLVVKRGEVVLEY